MPIRGRKPLREIIADNRAALAFLASAADKPPPEFLTTGPKERGPRGPSTGTSEGDVNQDIRAMSRSRPDVQLWRNNRGEVVLGDGKRLRYGVGPNGAADWIGYVTITVTPDMVGKQVAVFTAVEAKRPGKGARPDQQEFIERIRAAGGRAGVATSADEAGRVCDDRR